MPTIYTDTNTNSNNNTTSSSTGTTFPNNSSAIKINADNVVVTASRQFVTAEEKKALTNMLNALTGTAGKVMYKETYDKNLDGKVDIARRAEVADSISWENIIGKPDLTTIEIDEAVTKSHTHNNLEMLERLSYNDITKNLEYDNVPVINRDTYMLTATYDVDGDGTVDRSLYAESSNWEGIMNKPLFYNPMPHSHKASELSGSINADTLDGLSSELFMLKTDKITLNKIEDLDGLHINVTRIDGGNSGSEYDSVTSNETIIKFRNDIDEHWNSNNPILNKFEVGYEDSTYRHKIGNGISKWKSLPFEYNTPDSIRFGILVRNIFNTYTSNTIQPDVSLIDVPFLTSGFEELYSDTVRGNDDSIISIPYNATNILKSNKTFTDIHTFGNILETINTDGAGWYSGVKYKEFIYCAPYNSSSLLVIDTKEETVDVITDYGFESGRVNKYMRGTYCPENDKIYFAPCNTNKLLEIDPYDNSLRFYTIDTSIISSSSLNNFCDIVYNPVNKNLYLIPYSTNNFVEFNPITKVVKSVVSIREEDFDSDKFSCAVLAGNGLIYCIPSFGYDFIVTFDPNIHTLKYLPFNTNPYDAYRNAIYAPNDKIYIIPSGSTNSYVSEYDVSKDSNNSIYSITKSSNKWSGGVLLPNGKIASMPFTSGNILLIDLKLEDIISEEILSTFND